MTRHLSLALASAVFLVACSSSSDDKPKDKTEDKSDFGGVHVGAARSDTMPLRAGDVRIVAGDGGVDLALIGDTISSGLSQQALAKAKAETDTAGVKGSGFGAMIERTVKSSVQGALGTRVGFSIADISAARYQNGRIAFDWNGSTKKVFDNAKVNNKPLLESFSPADAQRFVDAVNARKHAEAR